MPYVYPHRSNMTTHSKCGKRKVDVFLLCGWTNACHNKSTTNSPITNKIASKKLLYSVTRVTCLFLEILLTNKNTNVTSISGRCLIKCFIRKTPTHPNEFIIWHNKFHHLATLFPFTLNEFTFEDGMFKQGNENNYK